MSEDLIERLRAAGHDERLFTGWLYLEAADRLETAQALLNAAKAREEAADVELTRLSVERELMEKEVGFVRTAYDQLVQRQEQEIERAKAVQAQRAEAAEATVERLNKDAQRYKWLRSPETAVVEICNSATPKEDGFTFMEGEQLDAAIDAAIAEANKDSNAP